MSRKLDFFLAVFNRPKFLHRILRTGLGLNLDGVHFVVFDDASQAVEVVPGLGPFSVEEVCRSFQDPRVIYVRNPTNIGFTKSLRRYYDEFCDADYVGLLNPKDEFIGRNAIANAIDKLDADPGLSMVVYPLQQTDRDNPDRSVLFDYDRMSGQAFVANYVRDSRLQHCGSYALVRVSAARSVDIPRSLNLREFGIDDGSGIDHDIIFRIATTGDVDFESVPPLRRDIRGGHTERFPLTFAYSQYLYARRLMDELEPIAFVSAETRRLYLSWWHLLIARGLAVAYNPVPGTTLEWKESRIRPHLRMPVLLFLLIECFRWRIWPSAETITTCLQAAGAMLPRFQLFTQPLRRSARQVKRFLD
jgi:hypothetical protein